MFGIVEIGEKEVPMLAMASVDIYYKHIFGEDPLKIQIKKDLDDAEAAEFYQKMGFVMAEYAELKDRKAMLELTEENYLEWMDTLSRPALFDALADIRGVYDGQKKETSEPKNGDGQ